MLEAYLHNYPYGITKPLIPFRLLIGPVVLISSSTELNTEKVSDIDLLEFINENKSFIYSHMKVIETSALNSSNALDIYYKGYVDLTKHMLSQEFSWITNLNCSNRIANYLSDLIYISYLEIYDFYFPSLRILDRKRGKILVKNKYHHNRLSKLKKLPPFYIRDSIKTISFATEPIWWSHEFKGFSG